MKRHAVFALAALFASVAQAQTIRYEVQTSAGVPVPGVARTTTQSACDTAIRAMRGEFHCHRITIGSAPPPAPAPVPAPPPPAPAPAPVPGAATLHFSDCQPGAAAGCVPGSNANPGTETLPKQNLAGVNVNTLPAGSRLLFARGGAWESHAIRLVNRNVTSASPLVFDAYGAGPKPILALAPSDFRLFEFGSDFSDPTVHGGYVIRNLVLQDTRTAGETWSFWLKGSVSSVLIENVEAAGFYTPINGQGGGAQSGIVMRNLKLEARGMGINGTFTNSTIEGVEFARAGATTFTHAIYLSGGNGNVVRNNRIVTDGICSGGNITVHGLVDGLVVEGNTIKHEAATEGCWGISINPYVGLGTNGFRNLVVRNNAVVNVGNCAICIQAAPGALVEGNVTRRDAGGQAAVMVRDSESTADLQGPATIRNNVACGASDGFTGPSGSTISGNTRRTGADATTGPCAR